MAPLRPDDWQPSGIQKLEPKAWDALRHDGSAYVAAGPGAGKTEFLAQRANYLFTTGACRRNRNILAISFKRDAARNLGERVQSRTPQAGHRFDSMTFDAFTKGLVDRFHAALPDPWKLRGDYEISFPGRRDIGTHLNDLAAQYPGRAAEIAELPRDNFNNEIVGTYNLPLTEPSSPTIRELAALAWWNRYRSSTPQRVDFVMLNRLAELVVRTNPAVHHALRLTYPFVFIDEFQDTTFAQYAFLRSVFGDGDTVVTAVGDDKQRIMGWAGALDDAFAEFSYDFGAQPFQLEWNHRSTQRLTALHHVVAKTLDPTAIPAVSQVADNNDQQALAIWHFDSLRAEAHHIAQWIAEDSNSSGRSPDRYAIVARQKTVDLQPLLETELAHVGINLRNDDAQVGKLRLQDLLSDELVSGILDIIRVAAHATGGGSTWDRTVDLISRLHDRSAEEDAVSLAHRELEHFVAQLRDWLRSNPPAQPAMVALLQQIVTYLRPDAIRSAFPTHRREGFLKETLQALAVRFGEVVQDAATWTQLCDLAEGVDAVSLMTIHKSKGLEYHTVIFLGLDDNQWWSYEQNPDEAIRTFFVGLSRAEQRTIFTYCTARGDRRNIDALYALLAEANVELIHP